MPFLETHFVPMDFPGGSVANAGNTGNAGSIPGSRRCPGGRNGRPLQYSCLKNPMDRGAWRATVQRVAQEWDMTEQLSTQHCSEKKYE